MYAKLSAEVLPELIPPNSKILAAVSGGPDSVAMAHVLWRYAAQKKEENISLVISHVHHGVRKESDKEAELVKSLAEKWNTPFIIHKFDAKKYAAGSGKSFQEAAREWRYARWQEDMKEHGCNLLATAHHLGDQAETVLYRLLRGSGTAGLAGIYPSKGNIIRPLLTVTKEEILDYCEKETLPYALDKSNFEPIYDRNRIRLELLPELERKYNYRIQEALGRTAELLRWDEEYISSHVCQLWDYYCSVQTEEKVCLKYTAWEEPEAVLSRLLRKAANIVSGDPRGLEYKFIKLIIKEGRKIGWKQDLPGMKVEALENGFAFFRRELKQVQKEGKEKDLSLEVPLLLDKWQEIPELGIGIGLFRKLPADRDKFLSTALDGDELKKQGLPLVCRTRKNGDRMYFKGVGHKELKKVFQENGISAARRKGIPLIAVGSLVVWIPGVCRSDSFLPSKTACSKLYILTAKIMQSPFLD